MIFRFKHLVMLTGAVFGRYFNKGLASNDSSTLVTPPTLFVNARRHAYPRLHLPDYLKMVAFLAVNSKERNIEIILSVEVIGFHFEILLRAMESTINTVVPIIFINFRGINL